MRLDKYLKISRIMKRRPVAKEACDSGRVLVNDKIAKAGIEVEEGDIIEIKYASKTLKVKVLNIKEHVSKDDAKNMYKIIQEE